MRPALLIFFLGLVYWSCNKDSNLGKPQLTMKKVSTTKVPVDGELQITLGLKDIEGDFEDTIRVIKKTTRPCPNDWQEEVYMLPTIPKQANFNGDIIVTFTYENQLQLYCNRADTATFYFWIRDGKGNISDTVKTPSIIVQK